MSEEWLGLGPVTVVDTYVYYDRPLLFLGESPVHGSLIVVLAQQDVRSEYWLTVPVSRARLRALKSHHITLRDAFTQPETGWVFASTVSYTEDPVVTVATALDEKHLPAPDVFI